MQKSLSEPPSALSLGPEVSPDPYPPILIENVTKPKKRQRAKAHDMRDIMGRIKQRWEVREDEGDVHGRGGGYATREEEEGKKGR
jgi:hypothetical protein